MKQVSEVDEAFWCGLVGVDFGVVKPAAVG